MEQWDLYNKQREQVCTDHIRGEKIPDGCYHLVVHVWIRNSDGMYLISQRSADRPTFPLMWECTGGSVIKGENSLTGAIQEAKEELGIVLHPENGTCVKTVIRDQINGKNFQDILDIWLFEFNGSADLEQAETQEVADARWMSYAQIQELYDTGKFVPTLSYFFNEPCFQSSSSKN